MEEKSKQSPHCEQGNHKWSYITVGGQCVCLRFACLAVKVKS